jgi:hypothetical protein
MYRKNPHLIQDNIFFKELRKTKSQGNITIPDIYEQIVLTRKENLSRVRMVGSGVKFKQTLASNVSSKCDLYLTDNEFYDHDQSTLISNSVVGKSFYGSFAFKVFEEVENDVFFDGKKVCRKGRIYAVWGYGVWVMVRFLD